VSYAAAAHSRDETVAFKFVNERTVLQRIQQDKEAKHSSNQPTHLHDIFLYHVGVYQGTNRIGTGCSSLYPVVSSTRGNREPTVNLFNSSTSDSVSVTLTYLMRTQLYILNYFNILTFTSVAHKLLRVTHIPTKHKPQIIINIGIIASLKT
jgi:hypothetical protein